MKIIFYQNQHIMTARLEYMICRKQYQQIQTEFAGINRESLPVEQKIVYDMAKIRIQLWVITAVKKLVADFHQFSQMIFSTCKSYFSTLPPVVISIHEYAMRGFLFQIQTNESDAEKQDMQRKFIKELTKLPPLTEISTDPLVKNLMDSSLYFLISLLELYTKKNTKIKRKQQRAEIDRLGMMIQDLARKEKQTIVLCKRLFIIIVHLKIHNSNTFSNDLSDQTLQHFDMCIRAIEGKQDTLIDFDMVVVLLYNCLKNMLGFNNLNRAVEQRIERLYKLFQISTSKKSYPWHILQLFFIIKITIFKQKKIMENDQIQQKLSEFAEKFSVFVNLNLDQIVVTLNQITRNIVRHKVASLSTIMGIKLGVFRFSKDFLQIMHDSPYNNDVQTIKLCFELFQFRQFQKIQNLLQTIMSVQATKKLKMREVLVSMCSILIGLYLGHRQQGLLYNKLNHQNFLALKNPLPISFKTEILKEQTFLQHVGFGYYNIAGHEPYLENRQIYLTKALQNFLKSYELNNDNYLLNYCMGKIYLQMYDYPNAYKHAMQACRSHRGSWAPFCLLACIYMSDRKFQKAYVLIEELLKKNPEVAILHFVRAYLEVNKMLLQVEHDQQIQAAKMLGNQYYLTHFERSMKHKSIATFTQYAQNYVQLSCGAVFVEEPDQNFLSPQNISTNLKNANKYLFNIIELLEEAGQYSVVQNMLKVFPQNHIQTLYHKAVLHEKRKQFKEARQEYLNILKLNHAHCPTLIKLAQLPKSEDIQSYKECYQYLEVASKYVNDGDFMLAKGIVLSKLNRIQQANKILLCNRDLAWCRFLPDLLYYY